MDANTAMRAALAAALGLLVAGCGGSDSVVDAPIARRPPVASADAFVLPAGQPTLIDVLANDSNPSGDALTISIIRAPSGAQARVVASRIEITPLAGVAGPTELDYRVRDSAGALSDATVRLVIGPATPLFFVTTDTTGARQVMRHDFLGTALLAAPVPAGERLDTLLPSADGRRLVYLTAAQGKYRVWVRELTNLAMPVREIPTPAGFAITTTNSAALSRDGHYGVFGNLFVDLDAPGLTWTLGGEAANAVFSRAGSVFYTEGDLLASGTAVMRATPAGSGISITQITARRGRLEGVQLQPRLTPDETLLLTAQQVASAAGLRLSAFATPTGGSQADRSLTDPQSSKAAGAVPISTLDGAYAVFPSTSGTLEVAPLKTAGFATTVETSAGSNPILAPQTAADSRTVFFNVSSAGIPENPPPERWYKSRIDRPGSAAPYAPGNLAGPQSLRLSPDGQFAIFRVEPNGYVTAAPDFDAPRAMSSGWPDSFPTASFSPDSHAFVVADATRLLLLNPGAPEWWRQIPMVNPGTTFCVIWAGGVCTVPP